MVDSTHGQEKSGIAKHSMLGYAASSVYGPESFTLSEQGLLLRWFEP